MYPRISAQIVSARYAMTHQKKSCLRCGSRSKTLAHASVNPLGLAVLEIVDIGRCVAFCGRIFLCRRGKRGVWPEMSTKSLVVISTDVGRNSVVTGASSRENRLALSTEGARLEQTCGSCGYGCQPFIQSSRSTSLDVASLPD